MIGQIYGEDFAKFCGLLRINELKIVEEGVVNFTIEFHLRKTFKIF